MFLFFNKKNVQQQNIGVCFFAFKSMQIEWYFKEFKKKSVLVINFTNNEFSSDLLINVMWVDVE